MDLPARLEPRDNHCRAIHKRSRLSIQQHRTEVPVNLPREYPYNPRSSLIVWCVCAGAAWIVLDWFESGHRPNVASLSFGLVSILMGLLVAARRLAINRCLILEEDALVLPTGFLQMWTARILYKDMDAVWQTYLPLAGVIRISTRNRKFQIVSILLPDNPSYIELREFLYSQAHENRASSGPPSRQPEERA